jgi:hypothetical protein
MAIQHLLESGKQLCGSNLGHETETPEVDTQDWDIALLKQARYTQ